MVEDVTSLPEDPTKLRAAAANLIELVKSQALQIEKLKHALAGHRRHRFGARSETLEQLELTFEEAEIGVASVKDTAPTDETPQPKQAPKRKPLSDSLPRTEQVLSPGETCSQCGGVSTHRNLLRLCREFERGGGCPHAERLVRPTVVVELDPVSDGAACVCQALEALAMDALFFERSDEALHHAVLLWDEPWRAIGPSDNGE